MIFYDGQIREWHQMGKINISPFDLECLQPASYDCRLGNEFLFLDTTKVTYISNKESIPYKKMVVDDTITIPAKSFVLATTQEIVTLAPNVTGFVEGRSSIGRLGLFVQNAGLIDAGFSGNITLELFNANDVPLVLEVGTRICQLVFFEMRHDAINSYCGKYQNQKGTTGTKANQDVEWSK